MRTTFTDGTIVIRPFVLDDVPSLYDASRESIETVGKWMPWCHPEYSVRESEEWVTLCQKHWAEGISCEFGIFGATSHEVWGGTGINQINRTHNFANLGYWVRTTCVQRGVASAAARLAAQFAFVELRLTRIEIVTHLENATSRRVAERLGAKFECVARNRLFIRGQSFDAAIYSLVPSDIDG